MANVENELKLDADAFKQKYKRDKPSENTEVIFHCLKGGRAQKGCDTAKALGFKKYVTSSIYSFVRKNINIL